MNEISNVISITNRDGVFVVSSREVAEKFEKRHDHVIRDIENIKIDVPNFGEMFFEAEYADSYGRKQRCYEMNRDGFSLLAMGFTGAEALSWKLKYIEAFNEMERRWNSPEQVMARALLIANERIETRDKVISMQTDKILKLKPKADFFDLTMNKNDLFTIQEAAQMIGVPGIGQNNLFKFLRQESIMQFRNPLPMQQYIDRGYFKVKNDPWESPDGNVYFSPKTLVTQKGLYFIAKRLEAKGYLPKRNLFS